MSRLAPVLTLTALALSACSVFDLAGAEQEEAAPAARQGVGRLCFPGLRRPPCRAGIEEAVPYRFVLLTHCGVAYAYFDGRYWLATPPLDDGSGNPPPAWGNPFERGTMTLEGDHVAVFVSDGGLEARFQPAPASYRPPGCA